MIRDSRVRENPRLSDDGIRGYPPLRYDDASDAGVGAKWVLWLFSSDHGYFSSLSELLPLISCTVQLGFLYRIGIK
jgi:hypothetical protein